MAVRIVRLGSSRAPNEGLRIGTVRRPPRGVPKLQFASRNYYDIWLPMLSPTPALVRQAQSAQGPKAWRAFCRKFKREMSNPDAARILDLLAALSSGANFSMGCYCEDESRCHRSVLRQLLVDRGATVI
jgi:uncharacterized protein YeaO (DUF488 family)